MYRELIEGFIYGHNWAKLREPCSEEELLQAEKYVGFTFPGPLKALLREANGDNWFLLSAGELCDTVRRNREILAEYLEPEEFEERVNRFIPFATNGCGDYYGYRVLENGEADTSSICIWEHELLEFRIAAEDIPDLITRYYNDEI